MKGVESYMHKFAKQTLATWLRTRSRVGANFKGLEPFLPLIPLAPKSMSPMYGVYEEYPICHTVENCVLGLCIGDWQAGNVKASKTHGIPSSKDIKTWNQNCQNKKQKLTMDWFFDVAIIDPVSSHLCFVFEVMHTNAMDERKITWLQEKGIAWAELKADWIMTRVKSPFSLTPGIIRSSVLSTDTSNTTNTNVTTQDDDEQTFSDSQ
jgi:hypothetical protein